MQPPQPPDSWGQRRLSAAAIGTWLILAVTALIVVVNGGFWGTAVELTAKALGVGGGAGGDARAESGAYFHPGLQIALLSLKCAELSSV